jgi:two-component system KDP operon response regulator KdpE
VEKHLTGQWGLCTFTDLEQAIPDTSNARQIGEFMGREILIVDDDPGIRRALRAIFQHAGYQTTEAGNGVDALREVRRNRYDLITMDMSMADMDGVDAISILRGETAAPIVAISAHLTEDIRSDLRNREVHHFLEKPFTLNNVLAVVHQALGED